MSHSSSFIEKYTLARRSSLDYVFQNTDLASNRYETATYRRSVLKPDLLSSSSSRASSCSLLSYRNAKQELLTKLHCSINYNFSEPFNPSLLCSLKMRTYAKTTCSVSLHVSNARRHDVGVHTHTNTRARAHTHTHTYKHARAHTQTNTETRRHTRPLARAPHTHTHTHTHTHARTHTHTHTHALTHPSQTAWEVQVINAYNNLINERCKKSASIS